MDEITLSEIAYKSHKASGTLERYRGSLIANELRNRGYDINYQIAIGFDKDTKPEKYAHFQSVRAECTALVDKRFAEMEQAEK
jgi:hypothetical protein